MHSAATIVSLSCRRSEEVVVAIAGEESWTIYSPMARTDERASLYCKLCLVKECCNRKKWRNTTMNGIYERVDESKDTPTLRVRFFADTTRKPLTSSNRFEASSFDGSRSKALRESDDNHHARSTRASI